MALTELTRVQRATILVLVEAHRLDVGSVDAVRATSFLRQAEERLNQLPLLTSVVVRYGIAYDACLDTGEALLAAYSFRTTTGPGQHEALGRYLRAVFDKPPTEQAGARFRPPAACPQPGPLRGQPGRCAMSLAGTDRRWRPPRSDVSFRLDVDQAYGAIQIRIYPAGPSKESDVKRHRQTQAAAGLAVVASMSLGLSTADATPVASHHQVTQAVLEDWAATRALFGLDTSRAQLLAVADDPDATSVDVGVPITAAEHAEMVRRQGLGRYIGLIESAGHDSPRYGGVAIDQAAGGVLVIDIVRYNPAVTKDRTFVARLKSLVPRTDPVAVRSVRYSEATMAQAIARFTHAFASGALRRYSVTSSSDSDQIIRVGIEPTAAPDTEAALHRLFPWPFLVVNRTAGPDLSPGYGRMATAAHR